MISSVHRETIPIFPLANVVLFPTIGVPLYIFEPRYRAMVRAALHGERRIGMIAIRPDAANRISDTPAVFSIGCEGEIDQVEERDDGTFDIRLVATHRFTIVEELGTSLPAVEVPITLFPNRRLHRLFRYSSSIF